MHGSMFYGTHHWQHVLRGPTQLRLPDLEGCLGKELGNVKFKAFKNRFLAARGFLSRFLQAEEGQAGRDKRVSLSLSLFACWPVRRTRVS